MLGRTMCESEDDHFSKKSARRLSPRHSKLKQRTALKMTKRSCGTNKVLTGARVPGRWSCGCSMRVSLATRASSAHKIFGNSHKTKDIGLLIVHSRHCQPSQVHVREEDEDACDDLHVLHTICGPCCCSPVFWFFSLEVLLGGLLCCLQDLRSRSLSVFTTF